MVSPKNEDLFDQKNPISEIANSKEEADLEQKDAADKNSNQEKEEIEKKERGAIGKVLDTAKTALKITVVAIKAVSEFIGFKPKDKLKFPKESLGDEEVEQDEEVDKWEKFFDKLLGKGKKSAIEERSSLKNKTAAKSPKDNSSSLRDSIFDLTSEAQNFMQEANDGQSADQNLEENQDFKSAKDESKNLEKGETKNNANDDKESKSTEDALRQMVESVALTSDPNLIKRCEAILEEARVQSPELENVTRNLSTNLAISSNKEVMGICNKLKSSDNIESREGEDTSASQEIDDVSVDNSGLSR